jgi:hypothetical protein
VDHQSFRTVLFVIRLRPVIILSFVGLSACGCSGGVPVARSGFASIGSDGLILTDPGAEQESAGQVRSGQSGF